MRSIIIVDDDTAIRDVYSLVFSLQGYEVTCFPDEKQILRNDFTEPDIFLIDNQLHGANGIDVCRFLKNRTTHAETPVIIFSASARAEADAKEAGAVAFLEKPFPNRTLIDLVHQTLNLVHVTS